MIQSKCPEFMTISVFERTFTYSSPQASSLAWQKLQLRETFTQGQIPPYRVEFDSHEQKGPFEMGELNIHHGPGLSVHGAIGEIRSDYRDLKYFYGSYVLSFRWIRPVRLEFFKRDEIIRLRLTCFVKPWLNSFWLAMNRFFWSFFKV